MKNKLVFTRDTDGEFYVCSQAGIIPGLTTPKLLSDEEAAELQLRLSMDYPHRSYIVYEVEVF